MKVVDYTRYTLKLWRVFNSPVHNEAWIFLRCIGRCPYNAWYTYWVLSMFSGVPDTDTGHCTFSDVHLMHTHLTLQTSEVYWTHTLGVDPIQRYVYQHITHWPFSELYYIYILTLTISEMYCIYTLDDVHFWCECIIIHTLDTVYLLRWYPHCTVHFLMSFNPTHLPHCFSLHLFFHCLTIIDLTR
jgi:hypothetical protein